MKILYLECNMGAAGDMLAAALLGLMPDPDGFVEELNRIGLRDVRFRRIAASKCGISGHRLEVTVHGAEEDEHGGRGHAHHHHAGLADIEHIVGHLAVPNEVGETVLAVYRRIAEAESLAHGCEVTEVHFHEVGALDAVADITAVCMLIDRLAPDRVVVSPVKVGFGQVRCAHGILPVPAPATEFLLRGIPCSAGEIEGELCTPTGAALLAQFADSFGSMPHMRTEAVGIGMGKKDFPAANMLRAFWGEAAESAGGPNGTVAELRCNLDDMTGEAIGFAQEVLFSEGALDVFTLSAGMKKSRPGCVLVCLCAEEDADRFAALMLKYTTTFGVRKTVCERYTLAREVARRKFPFGTIAVKTGEGYGVRKEKPEFDMLAEKAREKNLSPDSLLRIPPEKI